MPEGLIWPLREGIKQTCAAGGGPQLCQPENTRTKPKHHQSGDPRPQRSHAGPRKAHGVGAVTPRGKGQAPTESTPKGPRCNGAGRGQTVCTAPCGRTAKRDAGGKRPDTSWHVRCLYARVWGPGSAGPLRGAGGQGGGREAFGVTGDGVMSHREMGRVERAHCVAVTRPGTGGKKQQLVAAGPVDSSPVLSRAASPSQVTRGPGSTPELTPGRHTRVPGARGPGAGGRRGGPFEQRPAGGASREGPGTPAMWGQRGCSWLQEAGQVGSEERGRGAAAAWWGRGSAGPRERRRKWKKSSDSGEPAAMSGRGGAAHSSLALGSAPRAPWPLPCGTANSPPAPSPPRGGQSARATSPERLRKVLVLTR